MHDYKCEIGLNIHNKHKVYTFISTLNMFDSIKNTI